MGRCGSVSGVLFAFYCLLTTFSIWQLSRQEPCAKHPHAACFRATAQPGERYDLYVFAAATQRLESLPPLPSAADATSLTNLPPTASKVPLAPVASPEGAVLLWLLPSLSVSSASASAPSTQSTSQSESEMAQREYIWTPPSVGGEPEPCESGSNGESSSDSSGSSSSSSSIDDKVDASTGSGEASGQAGDATSDPLSSSPPVVRVIEVPLRELFPSVRNNGTLYAHVFLVPKGERPALQRASGGSRASEHPKQVYFFTPLTHHMKPTERARANLLDKLAGGDGQNSTVTHVLQATRAIAPPEASASASAAAAAADKVWHLGSVSAQDVAEASLALLGASLILCASRLLHSTRWGGGAFALLVTITSFIFVYSVLSRLDRLPDEARVEHWMAAWAQGTVEHGQAAAAAAVEKQQGEGALQGTSAASQAGREGGSLGKQPVAHWKGQLQLSMLQDVWEVPHVRGYDLVPLLRKRKLLRPGNTFAPILYPEEFMEVKKWFRPLNSAPSTRNPPLELSVSVVSPLWLRGSALLEQQGNVMMKMGMTDRDLDEIKDFFSANRMWVLVLTYVISLLHMMFDMLAFKNDIGFYKGRKDFSGLSSRTIVANFICSLIIYLYLIDSDHISALVLLSVGFSTLLELWKIKRVLRVRLEWAAAGDQAQTKDGSEGGSGGKAGSEGNNRGSGGRGCCGVRIATGLQDAALRGSCKTEAQKSDEKAMKYLALALYPLMASLALRSLFYSTHKGWWSWVISSLAHGVYAFGFIMMTPQLFVNYRLKSVSHLPWRVFMYKAFNTFIDDVFAFAIAMPTAHRLACLRDDVVFFALLYQRWLYPVDKKRANEYGIAYEGEEESEGKEGKKESQGEGSGEGATAFDSVPTQKGSKDVSGAGGKPEKQGRTSNELLRSNLRKRK